MSTATLIIFIKNPEAGKVKTRLAAEVGNEKALEIYHALLKHTRETVLSRPFDRLLFYSSFIDHQDEWPSQDFTKLLQEGDGLGDRMQHAFAHAFTQGGPVLIVGSDCPGLSPTILEEAIEHLQSKDFVIGPAMDGGYYLLGMRNYQPEVFSNMEWSTASVLPTTLERINVLQATYALLPMLSDVDYLADWEEHGFEDLV